MRVKEIDTVKQWQSYFNNITDQTSQQILELHKKQLEDQSMKERNYASYFGFWQKQFENNLSRQIVEMVEKSDLKSLRIAMALEAGGRQSDYEKFTKEELLDNIAQMVNSSKYKLDIDPINKNYDYAQAKVRMSNIYQPQQGDFLAKSKKKKFLQQMQEKKFLEQYLKQQEALKKKQLLDEMAKKETISKQKKLINTLASSRGANTQQSPRFLKSAGQPFRPESSANTPFNLPKPQTCS